MTETLLIIGMATAVVFVAILLIEGALRPGYNPVYHTGSELSLGERGWIQIASFLQLGAGMFAFALGVNQALGTPIGAVLLALFGLGMIAAGVFLTDPVRGYPPGSSAGLEGERTWHLKIHVAVAGHSLLELFAACLVLVRRLDGPWRLYTILTAGVGPVLTIGTALAYQRDAAYLRLVQRALILVYLIWIVLLGIHLV